MTRFQPTNSGKGTGELGRPKRLNDLRLELPIVLLLQASIFSRIRKEDALRLIHPTEANWQDVQGKSRPQVESTNGL